MDLPLRTTGAPCSVRGRYDRALGRVHSDAGAAGSEVAVAVADVDVHSPMPGRVVSLA
jgi:hypothetical protein